MITPPPVVEEPVVEETIVEEPVVEPSTEEIEEVEEKGGISLTVLIAIIVVIIIVIVVIVIIVISNKKKKEEQARLQQEMMARAEAERLQAERERAERERQLALEKARAAAPPPPPAPKLPDITLKLIKLGTKKDEIINLPITNECKFGRSQEKCDYAIPEDKSLSSLHCTFIYRNKKVYIRDEKSTNGSFINGIPLQGEHEIQKDDVIYIGSYKYRVMW